MKSEMFRQKSSKTASAVNPKNKWKIRTNLNPGDIGYLVYLHGVLYSKEYGYDRTFEAYVASGLGEFFKSYKPNRDKIWLAEVNDKIIGSIAVVGHSRVKSQIRWYLVHPDFRGQGLGRELLKMAVQYCKDRKFKFIYLWTTSELNAARYHYLNAGFVKKEEKAHVIWGKVVTEERYELYF